MDPRTPYLSILFLLERELARLSKICRKICIIMPNFIIHIQTNNFNNSFHFKSNLHYINYTNQTIFQIQTKASTINHPYQNQHIHILFQIIFCITHTQSILQIKFGIGYHVTPTSRSSSLGFY